MMWGATPRSEENQNGAQGLGAAGRVALENGTTRMQELPPACHAMEFSSTFLGRRPRPE